ncbi:MAG: hypothetical protein QM767_24080 [Anaeromyxobacter sp.]
MRRLALVTALALSGCASLGAPPAGFYRVPGTAPMPTPLSAREGAQSFRFELPAGVAYTVEAATAGDDLELRTEVKNGGRGAIVYALGRARVRAGEHALVVVRTHDDPSRAPLTSAMTTPAYREGQRAIAAGERLVVTRTLRLPEAVAAGDAVRLLERLVLEDAVTIGGAAEPVRVSFEKAR